MPAARNIKSVMVALSGGVDSAVCAALLLDAGHTVRCVYFIMSDVHLAGLQAAKDAAFSLGLALDTVDLRGAFREAVILPFCRDYCAGVTPNPCVICNPQIKFKALCDAADRHGCASVATGHYARVELRDGAAVLRTAASAARDQSYMLYRLRQEQLKRLILPLGALDKEHIRALARERALTAADAPDSQEICFIPDGDYPAYIRAAGFLGKQGRFIAPGGTILGLHRGVEYYTIGQRRGLGISYQSPLFVQEILPNGDIRLGLSDQVHVKTVHVADCVMNPLYAFPVGSTFMVKLRSAAKPAHCTVRAADSGEITLAFDSPQRAAAPGQSAVLYDGEYVAGGGIIRGAY